jgi:hypothetical protein
MLDVQPKPKGKLHTLIYTADPGGRFAEPETQHWVFGEDWRVPKPIVNGAPCTVVGYELLNDNTELRIVLMED